MDDLQRNRPEAADDPPPIFKTWNQMYLFVLICHALIITLFYLFTKMYS